jgi:hypothetical protein
VTFFSLPNLRRAIAKVVGMVHRTSYIVHPSHML